MAILTARESGRSVLFVGGLVATALVHVGILIAAVLAGRSAAGQEPTGPRFGTVVEVQAVKFGKPRDMSFLPHKEAPPTPRERPKLQLSNNAQALPHLKPDEKDDRPITDDPLKRTHADQFKNLADPSNTGTAEEEGDPNGLRGGTATVGKGPIYLQHLVAAIQNAWVVPTTINDAQLAKLTAQACIKIDASGKILEYKLSQPSGNDRFDSTLLAALSSIPQFEPPTPDVKDIVTGDGVCLNFKKDRP